MMFAVVRRRKQRSTGRAQGGDVVSRLTVTTLEEDARSTGRRTDGRSLNKKRYAEFWFIRHHKLEMFKF